MSASLDAGGAAAAAETPAAPRETYPDMRPLLPVVTLAGKVVKGFGRGSKELGIPTANLEPEALGPVVDAIPSGVYFGYAGVGSSADVHKMVMSIGWNPFYKNEKKTVEPHLLHTFPADFYGEELRLVICGYLRPEKNYPSLDALIQAIRDDISTAKTALDSADYSALAQHTALKPSMH